MLFVSIWQKVYQRLVIPLFILPRKSCLSSENSFGHQPKVICRYFTRNIISFPIELNEDIKKNYTKYGELANHAMRVHDGLCFLRTAVETHFDLDTQKEVTDAIGFLFETFVDDDTLTDMQKEATFNEGIRYSQKLFKDLIADMGE